MSDKEFYIGWMPNAPAGFVKHTRRVVLVLCLVFIAVAVALAVLQMKFSNAVFEFGKLTQVTGVYTETPVPAIKVVSGKDIFGRREFIMIPLVGYGKSGASGLMDALQAERKTSFEQKEIVLQGTLIYNDGKTFMQVDKNEDPLVRVIGAADSALLPLPNELGEINVKGEIVDPKCFFGIMKPGEGKPHKDCAIRCLLGGIPPVLHVQNSKGESGYYLLAGDRETLNRFIKQYVAEPITLTARAVKHDDWIVLYLDSNTDIRKISKRDFFFADAPIYCAAH